MTETLKLTFVRMNETNYQAQIMVQEWQDWCRVWDHRPDQPKVYLPYVLANASKYREENRVHINIVLQKEAACAQFDVILGP